MSKIAIYPGTFDPITLGHQDIIQRAAKLFDRLIVAVSESNTSKKSQFSISQRVALVNEISAKIPNVEVKNFQGLLIDFAKKQNANVIVRGLRTFSDFEAECQLASMNQKLDTNIETIFIPTKDQYANVSSSLIREIAFLKGDVTPFVDPIVAEAMKKLWP